MGAHADPERLPVCDAFPELLRNIPDHQRDIARRHALAPIESLPRGRWRPRGSRARLPGSLGVLIVDGLLTRDVVLGQTVATELVGVGDILRPEDHDGDAAPVPFDIEWSVLQPSRIAVLDRDFAAVVGHWPEMIELVVTSAVRRAHFLALLLAIGHLRRVDERLLVLMWHMADRWGKVTADGVTVPLKLTHQTLGRLVGAQRPSVTTALKLLLTNARLSRCPDGSWLLHGAPPDALERMRSEIAEQPTIRVG